MGIAGHQTSVVLGRGARGACQTGRGHLRHSAGRCGSERFSRGLRLPGGPAHAHTSGGGWWRDSLPLLCWSWWWVGQGEREPERWDKCVCVCVALCAEEDGGRENDPTMQGRPKPPLQGEGHRYPISGMTGTKLEPPLILTVLRGPLLCRKGSLGAKGKGPGREHGGRESE